MGSNKQTVKSHMAARCLLLLELRSMAEHSRRAEDRWHVRNSSKSFKSPSFRLRWCLCVSVQLKCLSSTGDSLLGSSPGSPEWRLSPAGGALSSVRIKVSCVSGALVGERAERTEDVMQDGPSEGSWVVGCTLSCYPFSSFTFFCNDTFPQGNCDLTIFNF